MIASAEAFGANIPKVALSHSLRIFCLIFGTSITSFFVADITTSILTLGKISWKLQSLTLTIISASMRLGIYFKLPAHSFIVPLFISLIINLGCDIQLRLIDLLLMSAQYFLGWNIASKFKGVTSQEVILTLKQVFIVLVITIPIWSLMVITLSFLSEADLASIILGLAPGGQAEIALIAIALKANLAVVIMLHLLRSLIITVVGPFAFTALFNPKNNLQK